MCVAACKVCGARASCGAAQRVGMLHQSHLARLVASSPAPGSTLLSDHSRGSASAEITSEMVRSMHVSCGVAVVSTSQSAAGSRRQAPS